MFCTVCVYILVQLVSLGSLPSHIMAVLQSASYVASVDENAPVDTEVTTVQAFDSDTSSTGQVPACVCVCVCV